MEKKDTQLKNKFAKIKAAQAGRAPASDVVVDTSKPHRSSVLQASVPKAKGRLGKPKTIWLLPSEADRLIEVDLYCRQHKVQADPSKIIRAAVRMLGNNEATLQAVRAVTEEDGRR